MGSPDSSQPLRFRPRLAPALLALAGLAILLNLGFWQLRRLHEKERIIALAGERLGLTPATLAEAMARPEAFAWRRVRAVGAYVPEETVFVFERRPPRAGPRGGVLDPGGDGYRVLTPLRADGLPAAKGEAAAILVDRGWIPESEQAGFLSKDPRRDRVEVVASLVPLEDEPAPARSDRKHRLFVTFKLSSVRAQVPFPLLPALLVRGDARDGDVPRGEWAMPRMSVDHLQYAATWFSLAAILAVMFVLGSRKRDGSG
jgi:surfeit locus 1 family protein